MSCLPRRTTSLRGEQAVLFFLLIFLLPVQLGRHFWPEWSYVLGLRVDYLSPTIYLTDLLVVGILGLWGLKKSKIKSQKLKIKTESLKILILPASVFCFLLINSFLAQNTGAAFYKFIKIIEFSLLGLYVAKNRKMLHITRCMLPWVVIYSSLIAIAQFLKQSSLNRIFWWLGERTFTGATPGIAKVVIGSRLLMRPYATFPHPNVLAGFILISLILFFPINYQQSTISKIFKWLALILGGVAILISFSRSVWLVGVLIGLWTLLRHLRGGGVLREARGNTSKVSERMFDVFLQGGKILVVLVLIGTFFYFAPQFSTDEAFFQRLQLIKVSSLMIQSAPLVGVGLNNFIVRLPEFWQNVGLIYWLQPVHNIFLLVAVETGFVGLAIFIWFLILTYKKLLNGQMARWSEKRNKKPSNHPTIQPLLLPLALSTILVLGFFDHYWFTLQQTQLLFSIVLGLSWQAKKLGVDVS